MLTMIDFEKPIIRYFTYVYILTIISHADCDYVCIRCLYSVNIGVSYTSGFTKPLDWAFSVNNCDMFVYTRLTLEARASMNQENGLNKTLKHS